MVAFTSVLLALLVILVAYVVFKKLFGPKYNLPPGPSGLPWFGNAFQFGVNPVKLMKDAFLKFGDVLSLKVFGETIVLLTGPEATTLFFSAGEDTFSAAEAYKFTVPVFGKGVVYDGPPHKLVEQRRFVSNALTVSRFKKYVGMMERECQEYFDENWGDEGTAELMSSLSEVTVLTSTRCLQGKEIRETMSKEFSKLYFELDAALSPIGFFFPNIPLPGMRARDRARARMDEIFAEIIAKRRANPDEVHEDVVQTLIEAQYKDGETLPDSHIAGLMVALLLAGQHTSNVTGSWLGAHILTDPTLKEKLITEQLDLGEGPLDWPKIKGAAILQSSIEETLRLHPPIVMLMRKVLRTIEYNGYDIPQGSLVAVSPALQHRLDDVFPNPDEFDEERFRIRKEGKSVKHSYIAFGAGSHACIGTSFAHLQIKTVWSYLLRNYDIELVGEFPEPNYQTLIIGPKPPITIKFKRRRLFEQ